MSTVLRPVGPLDPRVYWIRRAVIIGIILVLIIVLAEACSGGGGSGKKNNSGLKPTTPSTTSSTTPATTLVPACVPSDLNLTLSTDTTTYTVQQAPKLIGTFSNPTGPTCKLARSAATEIWTIKSGTPVVWSTQGCPGAAVPKQLKISQGATKIVSIFWNAHLRTTSCTEGAFAQAGEYTLSATLDGVTAPRAAVFHIS